jgi:hypothetical protein
MRPMKLRAPERARFLKLFILATLATTCRDYDIRVPTGIGGSAAGSKSEGMTGAAGNVGGAANDAGGAHVGSAAVGGTNEAGIEDTGGETAGQGVRGRSGSEQGGATGDSGEGNGSGEGGRSAGGSSGSSAGGQHTTTQGGGRGATIAGAGGNAGAATTEAPGAANTWGAVRISIAGKPTCAGTLIANSWVLTADHCFDDMPSLEDVSVGFGSDATNFAQTRAAFELVHFDGNTPDVKVHDLALLGVDAPFEIDGSRTQQYFRLMPFDADYVGLAHRCVAWDLEPDPTSDETQLHEVELTAVAISGEPEGFVWWENTNPLDPAHGALLMPTDAGAGCFLLNGSVPILATVHVGNPSLRFDQQPNEDEEAYSLSLADQDIQDWVAHTLFKEMPDAGPSFAGAAEACSPTEDEVDLFGTGTQGDLRWYRRSVSAESWAMSAAAWVEQPALPAPQNVSFSTYRPGALCLPDGSIELVVPDTNGALWWQHFDGSAWQSAWSRVTAATSVVASGVSVIGQRSGEFEVIARDADTALRRASFSNGWAGNWENFGTGGIGSPAARMGLSTWFDVYGRDSTQPAIDSATNTLGKWTYSSLLEETTTDPAVASWGPQHVDSFAIDPNGTLLDFTYESFWSEWVVSTGLKPPTTDLTATTRGVGSVDVFASGAGSPVWHVVWPRAPE